MIGIYKWLKVTYITFDEIKLSLDILNEEINILSLDMYSYGLIHRPKIICNDGFSVSVQGGKGAYSKPRNYVETYDQMEIGFPTNFNDPEFSNNDGQVCGYVPIENIQKVILRHGGINMKETLKDYKYNRAINYFIEERQNKLKRILNGI